MTTRGSAYVLAYAIYAGTRGTDSVQIDDVAQRIYDSIDSTVFRTDEAKSDLYARLAECLTESTPFDVAVGMIEAAMERTRVACREDLACL